MSEYTRQMPIKTHEREKFFFSSITPSHLIFERLFPRASYSRLSKFTRVSFSSVAQGDFNKLVQFLQPT